MTQFIIYLVEAFIVFMFLLPFVLAYKIMMSDPYYASNPKKIINSIENKALSIKFTTIFLKSNKYELYNTQIWLSKLLNIHNIVPPNHTEYENISHVITELNNLDTTCIDSVKVSRAIYGILHVPEVKQVINSYCNNFSFIMNV